MTVRPQNIAERPGYSTREALRNDALSDVLHTIHLRGQAVSLHHGSGRSSADLCTDVRALHAVEAGTCVLQVDTHPKLEHLEAGDLVLVPLGTAHQLRGSTDAMWVSGVFEADDPANRFLGTLPPVIVVPANSSAPTWRSLGLHLLREELATPRPGGRVMVSRILDLLLIQMLRTWSAAAQQPPGLLRAALDPTVGRALAAIHADPSDNWTIAKLAHHSTSSRSAFAERFRTLAGVTPAAYLSRVRLDRAAELLSNGSESVGAVAVLVGYASEAAFSRAFRRQFGQAPGQWRVAHRPEPSAQERGRSGKKPDVRRM